MSIRLILYTRRHAERKVEVVEDVTMVVRWVARGSDEYPDFTQNSVALLAMLSPCRSQTDKHPTKKGFPVASRPPMPKSTQEWILFDDEDLKEDVTTNGGIPFVMNK